MHSYDLKGITVLFPFPAYNCQLNLMKKMISSLQSGQNALLESPTGTGKTLCLLCATLAWKEAYVARRQLEEALLKGLKAEDGSKQELLQRLTIAVSNNPRENFMNEPPKIFYASRTHSQLTQAVGELRNTAYRPNVCVLGSREQMCINEEVLRAPPLSRGNLCKQKISRKACEFHNGLENARTHVNLNLANTMMDIEDLVKFGQTHRACPYFLSREEIAKADIIFLPYNYLIDPYTRKAQGIDVKNAILIFDEGHNLESSCGEATSFEISTTDLSVCLHEAQQCISVASSPGYVEKDASAEDFAILRALIQKFRDELLAIPLSKDNDLIKPGEFIFQLFSNISVTFDNVDSLLKVIDSAMDLIAEVSHQQRRSTKMALNGFQTALKTVFREGYGEKAFEMAAICKSYKVHVSSQFPTRPVRDAWGKPLEVEEARTLSFWCFNSGIAMKDLVERGARSVILASGTLVGS
ncbi:Regulator of telomere elongation helicase 1 [Rhizophlyctis rosea]|uniref:Regulator of telomere elongation helicase 1 n=1 Tax=Rhizophlyctis rosea TaxID=64517 RepID=A0AAD5X324_9FUNG|nr:Regulator of telomere elongation helicase 1 [Rhizophlyctis rosea]